MSDCIHCAGRGWGIRRGYVRRCELCEVFPHDEAARKAAEPKLSAFALRERPVATPSLSGVVSCPWCSHVPTNDGDDVFSKMEAEEVFANAKFERTPNGPVALVFGQDQIAAVNHGDSFLACPACGRTFEVPEDFPQRFRPM